MTLKSSFGKCLLLFYKPMDDQNMDSSFPAKENPNMGKVLFDWPIVLQYNAKAKYRKISRKFFGHEVLSAERSLNQPKATRVFFVRQTNQVALLFCSRFHFKVIRKSLYLI